MYLNHFTALEYLPSIVSRGLFKGDIPTSPTGAANGLWLTTASTANGHGLSAGGPYSQAERMAFTQVHGHAPPPNARWFNKRRIRLSVDIPTEDIALRPWREWAIENGVSRHWRRTLDRTAGGGSSTWWLYFGVIPAGDCEAYDMDAGGPIEGWPYSFGALCPDMATFSLS